MIELYLSQNNNNAGVNVRRVRSCRWRSWGKQSMETKKITLNIATICNNLQELAKPKINFVPSQCQKESKAVRRLERNRDKVTKLFNH